MRKQYVLIAILALVGAMSLNRLGVAPDIVNLAFGLLLGGVAVAIALAFGLGGREVAKETLVTYGRTLKSVGQNEVVMLNISFMNNDMEVLPASVTSLQIAKASIDAYTKGSKSLEEVKKEVIVR